MGAGPGHRGREVGETMTERSEAEASTDQLRPSQATLRQAAVYDLVAFLDSYSPGPPKPLSAEDRRIADAF